MSKYVTLGPLCIMVLLWSATGYSQEANSLLAKSYPARATIRASLTLNDLKNPCSSSDNYANKCLAGPCTCSTYNNAIVSGNLVGAGSGTLMLTIDTGDFPSTGSNPNSDQTCKLFHGAAIVSTTTNAGASLSTTIELQGSLCFHPLAHGARNPLTGGFALASSSSVSYGWGTISGYADDTTNRILLKLKGTYVPKGGSAADWEN